MTQKLGFKDKIGILDPEGKHINPLNDKPYSDNYKKLAKIWSSFPAYEKAETLLDAINTYQLIFIISGTGSGKTTLVPKFALHYTNYRGKIAISLPKRDATASAAEFSATSLDVNLGTSVGYVYKGSDKSMYLPENRLVYMTDGFLVMKIVEDPLLSEYDIVIVDEAHERKIQIDMLLLFLKKILDSKKRPDFRVIIMSATIDGTKYQKYFSGIQSKIINISGQPNYKIDTFFLEKPSHSYMLDGLKLIEKLVDEGIKKDMLFFITTSNEAVQLCRSIRPKYPRIYCIEVYADMDKKLRVYAQSKDKYLELENYDQKLIMATNVAESSLTIDGLTYVIDSCYELHKYFDPSTFGQIFEKRLISKAQAQQRRGRVGRTAPGICYHLVTKTQFDALNDYAEPDILKHDITMDLLKIIRITSSKTYDEGLKLMNELMDPPKKRFCECGRGNFKNVQYN